MRIFELDQEVPEGAWETYSLTDQICRSSRSAARTWLMARRKRQYEAAVAVGRLEAEAAETQTWIQFAVRCEYLLCDIGEEVFREYDAKVLGMLITMITNPFPTDWVLSQE